MVVGRGKIVMLKFCIVYEDVADANVASSLADRVVCESVKWLEEDASNLEYVRQWVDVAPNGRRLRWTEIDDIGRDLRLPVRRYENWESDQPDFKAGLRALRVIKALFDDVAVVVLIRDADNQLSRGQGLKKAREVHLGTDRWTSVVIGLANTKRECWVLSGFIPCNDLEMKLLAEVRQCLGFDPTEKSHDLTAKHSEATDKRSAKRVLKKLTGENQTREEECWTKTPLKRLRASGVTNGLADYLREVEEILVPIIVRPEGRGVPG